LRTVLEAIRDAAVLLGLAAILWLPSAWAIAGALLP
jgi:hypothetical protein